LTLLVGAGLLLRSFASLQDIEPGFDPTNTLTVSVTLPETDYSIEQTVTFGNQLLAGLRGLPGVEAAGLATDTPLAGGYSAIVVATEDARAIDPQARTRVYVHSISPGYLEAVGAELRSGRDFLPSDTGESLGAVIVSESMAARSWSDEEPIGKRLTRNGTDWLTVVGVIGDIRHRQLVVDTFLNPDDPDVYFPLAQARSRNLSVVVRSRGEPLALAGPVRRLVQEMNRNLPVFGTSTMAEIVATELAINRASARMLTLFGVMALLLASIGTHGVMATMVAARAREIGIRISLGAERAHIVGLVLRQGLGMALLGIAVGIGAALSGARLLDSLLYEVSATDGGTIVAVSGVLVVVTALASYVPARRALRVEPIVVLRGD